MPKPAPRATLIAAAVLWPAVTPAGAIDTNRPGFSFTPGIVAIGQFQVESGITYTRFDSRTDNLALPAAELRFGIAERIEAFVSSVSWTRTESGGGDVSGLVDPAAGIKVGLGRTDGPVQMALLFSVTLPLGADEVSSDRWDPTGGFIWTASSKLPLAGTVTISDTASGLLLSNGLKLPFSLGNDRSAFFEWEANLPEEGDSTHWLNGGFQWLPGDRWQIDLNAGLGLNDDAGDYRAGVGFSFRL